LFFHLPLRPSLTAPGVQSRNLQAHQSPLYLLCFFGWLLEDILNRRSESIADGAPTPPTVVVQFGFGLSYSHRGFSPVIGMDFRDAQPF
jgi:hypothetical protein